MGVTFVNIRGFPSTGERSPKPLQPVKSTKAGKIRQETTGKYTFAEYAAEWLPTYKSEVTAKVYDDYAARLNKIASILPKVEMRLITPSDIQRLYNAFANRGDATRKK